MPHGPFRRNAAVPAPPPTTMKMEAGGAERFPALSEMRYADIVSAISTRSYVVRSSRFFAALGISIFTLGIFFAFSGGMVFMLLILGVPLVGLIAAVGALYWFVRGMKLAGAPDRSTRSRAVLRLGSPILLALLVLAAFPLIRAGTLSGSLVRLWINHPTYSRIIALEQSGVSDPSRHYREAHGITYIADRGPPLRIAFHPEGLLDNWSGIIFDPTGDVSLARGFEGTGRPQGPERVTRLFGGDLVDCRHLWGQYFRCSFT